MGVDQAFGLTVGTAVILVSGSTSTLDVGPAVFLAQGQAIALILQTAGGVKESVNQLTVLYAACCWCRVVRGGWALCGRIHGY